MAVTIKNLVMPKDCNNCPFYDYQNDYADECYITKEEIQGLRDGEKGKLCPLEDRDAYTELLYRALR